MLNSHCNFIGLCGLIVNVSRIKGLRIKKKTRNKTKRLAVQKRNRIVRSSWEAESNQIFIVLRKTRVKRDIWARYDFITLIMDSPLRQLPEKQTLYIRVHERNVMILCVPGQPWQEKNIYILLFNEYPDNETHREINEKKKERAELSYCLDKSGAGKNDLWKLATR